MDASVDSLVGLDLSNSSLGVNKTNLVRSIVQDDVEVLQETLA